MKKSVRRLRGAKGEWYVALQVALFGLVGLGPARMNGLPAWPLSEAWSQVLAAVLLQAGLTLVCMAAWRLGRHLSPLPHPREGAPLIEDGPFRWMRHPIYTGLVLMALGLGCWRQGWLGICWALVLLAFFDLKARREESWLITRYPAYGAYRQRVRKFIPGIY